jgi:catechol 2,3-dioxygenase
VSGALLPDGARVSEVALTVADLPRAAAFYEETLGFQVLSRGADSVALGAGEDAFLQLVRAPGAEPARGTTGLYHFAVLYPSRGDLARAVRRVIDAGWPLYGASDHLVSEAIYLSDPDGNGIELYRDRPRDEWPRAGDEIRMATLPLDLPRLLGEAEGSGPAPDGTAMGHVHLHVRDLLEAERFYRDVVGLAVTTRFGGSASFLAAGGYHHHLGINTWGTAGAPPAPEGALGLRWYRLTVPDGAARSALEERLRSAGVPIEAEGGESSFHDPSGHKLVVGVA